MMDEKNLRSLLIKFQSELKAIKNSNPNQEQVIKIREIMGDITKIFEGKDKQ